MSGKEINFGTEGRALMLRGVDQLADAVSVTLGPKGRNAILDQPYGAPKITKDGVTVAKNIEFRDRFENMGAQLVRQVATRTNDAAGDGTTTATVLTRAIFAEGVKAVAAGMNPSDLRRGIRAAAQQVVKEIEAIAKPISSREEIAQVATISANSEREIGDLISEAMERVGKEGVITVNDGKTLDNELDVVEGMKFDRGYISPYFATDPKTQVFDVEDPLILLVEKKVSSIQSIVPLLETVVKAQRPLLVVAEDVESEALATLVVNKLRAGIKVCAVKAPGFGDNRRETLQDLAALTGATVVSDDVGLKLEQATLDHLGSCKRCTVSKDDAIVLDGGGARADVEARCDAIRDLIAASTSDYEREKLQERLAKLGGGVAVIKVGGASEVEVSEKKDRVVDALNATALNVTALNATALKATALRPLPRVVAPHVGVALPGAVALAHAPGRPLAAVAPHAPLVPGVMGWRVYCMAWVWAALMGMNPASLSYTQPPTMTPTGSSDGASFAQIMLIVWFWFLWVATPALQIPLLVFMLLFTLAKKMFCPFFVFLIWFIIAASSG